MKKVLLTIVAIAAISLPPVANAEERLEEGITKEQMMFLMRESFAVMYEYGYTEGYFSAKSRSKYNEESMRRQAYENADAVLQHGMNYLRDQRKENERKLNQNN